MSIPFHKQTDASKQAGQVVFCSCKDRYNHQCPGEWEQGCDLGANEKHVVVVQQDKTLTDYINRKTEASKKITFDEWWSSEGRPSCGEYYRESCHLVWNAALKQGKL